MKKSQKTLRKRRSRIKKSVVDPIIPTNNSFASLVLDDAADPQDESPMVEDRKPRAIEENLDENRPT
ncbi:hypothetical protein TNCV_3651181 [Trichonephila clavipes]|nr:hypothetical protein TNCV_3651181 [Trichonephila clavipes]